MSEAVAAERGRSMSVSLISAKDTLTAVALTEHVGALLGQVTAAVVVLIAACPPGVTLSVGHHVRYWDYTIAFGTIAMFFSLLSLVLLKMKPELYEKELGIVPKTTTPLKLGYCISVFLFVWWMLGAFITTFGFVLFINTSNGYFAAWGGFICSVVDVGVSPSSAKTAMDTNTGPLVGLMAFSLVVLIATATHLDSGTRTIPATVFSPKRVINVGITNEGETIYGLVVAVLSLLLAACLMGLERAAKPVKPKVQLFVLLFFSLMWIFAACVLTFRGPFTTTSNGYFGAWAGLICCIAATAQAAKTDSDDASPPPPKDGNVPMPTADGSPTESAQTVEVVVATPEEVPKSSPDDMEK